MDPLNKTCPAFRVSWSCVSPMRAYHGAYRSKAHEAVPLFSFPITHDPMIVACHIRSRMRHPDISDMLGDASVLQQKHGAYCI
jgi:hypothetical protein